MHARVSIYVYIGADCRILYVCLCIRMCARVSFLECESQCDVSEFFARVSGSISDERFNVD